MQWNDIERSLELPFPQGYVWLPSFCSKFQGSVADGESLSKLLAIDSTSAERGDEASGDDKILLTF